MRRQFRIILIKPSHYDDDGYVIQWWRSNIPSNSLASVYALFAECAEDKHTRARHRRRNRSVRRDQHRHRRQKDHSPHPAGGRRLHRVRRRAVESVPPRDGPGAAVPRRRHRGGDRRFPRQRLPVDAARRLPPDLQEALDLGITLFAGEAEERMDELLRDAHAAQLQAGLQLPQRPAGPARAPCAVPAAGRSCSAIAAHTPLRRRARLPVPVQLLHHHQRPGPQVPPPHRRRRRGDRARQLPQGVKRFFITDDDFARNRNWEPILDRLIELRERKGSRSG